MKSPSYLPVKVEFCRTKSNRLAVICDRYYFHHNRRYKDGHYWCCAHRSCKVRLISNNRFEFSRRNQSLNHQHLPNAPDKNSVLRMRHPLSDQQQEASSVPCASADGGDDSFVCLLLVRSFEERTIFVLFSLYSGYVAFTSGRADTSSHCFQMLFLFFKRWWPKHCAWCDRQVFRAPIAKIFERYNSIINLWFGSWKTIITQTNLIYPNLALWFNFAKIKAKTKTKKRICECKWPHSIECIFAIYLERNQPRELTSQASSIPSDGDRGGVVVCETPPQSEPLALVKPKPVAPPSNEYSSDADDSIRLPFAAPRAGSAFVPYSRVEPIPPFFNPSFPVLPINDVNVDFHMYHYAYMRYLEHLQMMWNLSNAFPGDVNWW